MNTDSTSTQPANFNQEDREKKVQFEKQAEQASNQTNTAAQGEQASDNTPPNLPTGEAAMSEGGTNQGRGNQLTLENLPQDAKEALPEEAQHLFIAAYNSILDNNGDEQAAARIAWQTIETNEHYERGSDGKWKRIPDTADKKGGDKTMIHETAP